jgi:hypothetical protein
VVVVMTGTIATHASSGHPWPGGSSVGFEQRDVVAIGSLSAYNDFVKRYLVRLVDGREAFVKFGDQPEADRRWLSGIARALRKELRERAVDGTLAVPTRDLSFVIYWRDVAAADRMSDVPKKTPKQLDAEIAAALTASAGYYYVADRGGHRTLYGPYMTQRGAEFAGYFHKPVADRDATPANVFFMRGVQQYNEDEIKSLTRDPEEWGFKSVKLAHRAPPMHASWKKLGDDDFRQYLRNEDYERAELMSRRG